MAPSPNQKTPPKDENSSEIRDMEMPQHIINADSESSSGSDDEDPSHMGYQLLPQEPDALSTLSSRTPNEHRSDQVVRSLHSNHVEQELWKTLEPGSGFVPSGAASGPSSLFPEASACTKEAEERCQVWNEVKKTDAHMPEGTIDAIRNAMCGFSLPESHVPLWANTLEEKEWKDELLTRLQTKNPKDKK